MSFLPCFQCAPSRRRVKVLVSQSGGHEVPTANGEEPTRGRKVQWRRARMQGTVRIPLTHRVTPNGSSANRQQGEALSSARANC
jgi:hypothetical protein